MSNETAIKFMAFMVITAIPAAFLFNMLMTKHACETATSAYVDTIKLNSISPEEGVKEFEMQSTCKAMSIQARVVMPSK